MSEDAPLELPDRTLWLKNGVLHRSDGPAVEFKSGEQFWFLEGKQVTEQDAITHRQEIERQAIELSDKLLHQQYDLIVKDEFTVGHALPPFKKKSERD
jgi:hypothetical protein